MRMVKRVKKLKLSLYRSGRPLRTLQVEAFRIIRQSAHEGGEVVSLKHQPPLPHKRYSWYSFILLSQLQGHPVVGRIRLMKSTNYPIVNRTRELPACSAVPQPTAPPRTPLEYRFNMIVQRECEFITYLVAWYREANIFTRYKPRDQYR